MKFSPLALFLILLIILVLSVLFCRWAQNNTEGYINFAWDTEATNRVNIPMYSNLNQLYKIHDNIFFDIKNGNLVEVEGPGELKDTPNSTTPPDNSAINGIKKLHIVRRIGGVETYIFKNANRIVESIEDTMSSSYNSKIYETKGTDTFTYTVFVMPWYDKTFIHVMKTPKYDMAELNQIISDADIVIADENSTAIKKQDALTDKGNATDKLQDANNKNYETTDHILTNVFSIEPDIVMPYPYTPVSNMGGITESRNDSHSNNNKMVLEPLYNSENKVYQISEFVKFDIRHAHLLVSSGADRGKSITIYDHTGKKIKDISTTVNDSADVTTNGDGDSIADNTMESVLIPDISGQNMILYVANAKNTLVALIHYDNNKNLSLRNVCRFTPTGLDSGDNTGDNTGEETNQDSGNESETGEATGINYAGRAINERALNRYFRNMGMDMGNYEMDMDMGNYGMDMDNYMLKSQIVPPVCPAYPSCNYNTGGNVGGTWESIGKS